MYDLQKLTAPTLKPITLAEAKRHLKIRHRDDDVYIDTLIESATLSAEITTYRQFLTATYTLTLDCFPSGVDPIFLPLGQFQTPVGSLKWWDHEKTLTTMTVATDIYELGSVDYTVITPVTSWPSTARKVELVFTCGYGSTRASVPQLLKQGLLILVEHFNEQRELMTTGSVSLIPDSVDKIFEQYRLGNEYTRPVMGETSWMVYGY